MFNWVSRIASVVGLMMAILAPSISPAQTASDERLSMALPPGYVLAHKDGNQKVSLTEYTIEGETVHNWSKLITVVEGRGLGHVSLDHYAEVFIGGLRTSCPKADVSQITKGHRNGYEFITLRAECPVSPRSGKIERFWTTLIKGRDAIYSVQYAFSGASIEEQSQDALGFLETVSLCDTQSVGSVCLDER